MKPRVLVTENIHAAGWETLKREVDAVAWPGQDTQPLSEAIADVQAVLVRVAKISADVIKAAKTLKIIGKHGVGYDNIDIPAATASGVIVTNTPLANSTSVAEHALTLLLAVARRIGETERDLTRGTMRTQQVYQGTELSGKVMGVIGLGSAGLRLARMTGQGLGMRVLGFDPYKVPWPDGIEHCTDLDPLLRQADFISIHVPLTKETTNLIGTRGPAQDEADGNSGQHGPRRDRGRGGGGRSRESRPPGRRGPGCGRGRTPQAESPLERRAQHHPHAAHGRRDRGGHDADGARLRRGYPPGAPWRATQVPGEPGIVEVEGEQVGKRV